MDTTYFKNTQAHPYKQFCTKDIKTSIWWVFLYQFWTMVQKDIFLAISLYEYLNIGIFMPKKTYFSLSFRRIFKRISRGTKYVLKVIFLEAYLYRFREVQKYELSVVFMDAYIYRFLGIFLARYFYTNFARHNFSCLFIQIFMPISRCKKTFFWSDIFKPKKETSFYLYFI